MVVSKEDIRKEILKKRKSLPAHVREDYDRAILSKLKTLEELKEARTILLYCATNGEPDVTALFEDLKSIGKRVAFPKVEGSEIVPVAVEGLSCLSPGTFNIPEPTEGEIIEPMDLDLVVCPGIAFDREGYRVGFGKGYYDRLLERVSAVAVGVAYSFQVLEFVPRDSWDKPMNLVVTEKELIRRL